MEFECLRGQMRRELAKIGRSVARQGEPWLFVVDLGFNVGPPGEHRIHRSAASRMVSCE